MADETPRTKVLRNGAVYDLDAKRIVKGATLDTAQASAMATRRQELKREALAAGALRGTRDILQREPVHELEWVEVLAEANMHRAADPDNPKGVDASRFLLQESGLAEPKGAQTQAATVQAQGDDLVLIVMRRRLMADVVDAEASGAE